MSPLCQVTMKMVAGLAYLFLISSLSVYSLTETIDDAVDHLLADIPASLTDDQPLSERKLPGINVWGLTCEPGILEGLDTVYRTGHCTLDVVSDTEIAVNLKIGFKNLTAHYPVCSQFSFFKTDMMIATFQNSFDAKIELLKYNDQPGCHPAVKSISVDPYSSLHSSSLLISLGSGLLRKSEAFLVKTLLRIFKVVIEKLINNIALKQSWVINDVNICNLISEN